MDRRWLRPVYAALRFAVVVYVVAGFIPRSFAHVCRTTALLRFVRCVPVCYTPFPHPHDRAFAFTRIYRFPHAFWTLWLLPAFTVTFTPVATLRLVDFLITRLHCVTTRLDYPLHTVIVVALRTFIVPGICGCSHTPRLPLIQPVGLDRVDGFPVCGYATYPGLPLHVYTLLPCISPHTFAAFTPLRSTHRAFTTLIT